MTTTDKRCCVACDVRFAKNKGFGSYRGCVNDACKCHLDKNCKKCACSKVGFRIEEGEQICECLCHKEKIPAVNYLQVGKQSECGHCNPKEYGEGLRQAQASIPNFICECTCHKEKSHSHCWEQKQPPACGLKGHHKRCCLCEATNIGSDGAHKEKELHLPKNWNKVDGDDFNPDSDAPTIQPIPQSILTKQAMRNNNNKANSDDKGDDFGTALVRQVDAFEAYKKELAYGLVFLGGFIASLSGGIGGLCAILLVALGIKMLITYV